MGYERSYFELLVALGQSGLPVPVEFPTLGVYPHAGKLEVNGHELQDAC